MYSTRTATPKSPGLFCEFEVTSRAEDLAYECRKYGSGVGSTMRVPLSIERVALYSGFLPLAKIKGDAVLSHSQFVRRNFQGTLFKMTRSEYNLMTILVKNELDAF